MQGPTSNEAEDMLGYFGDLKRFLQSTRVPDKWFEKLKEQDITLEVLKAGYQGVPGIPKVDVGFLTGQLGLGYGAALSIMRALDRETADQQAPEPTL